MLFLIQRKPKRKKAKHGRNAEELCYAPVLQSFHVGGLCAGLG
jgi:hypothetical protein